MSISRCNRSTYDEARSAERVMTRLHPQYKHGMAGLGGDSIEFAGPELGCELRCCRIGRIARTRLVVAVQQIWMKWRIHGGFMMKQPRRSPRP